MDDKRVEAKKCNHFLTIAFCKLSYGQIKSVRSMKSRGKIQ